MSASRVSTIRKNLLTWYHQNKRELPWRGERDPYRIWLSEIILQQTRVDQGTPYYLRFVDAYPTVEALANAPEDRILKHWEGLGYYSRARNMHKAAREIAEAYAGRFPDNAEALQALPGVGRYTAGAIASIAYGEAAPVVDGNVMRVLSRLFDVADSIDDAATKDWCWEVAEKLVPKDTPGDFNQAMMELGACVCTPNKAACAECPLKRVCAARAAGTVNERPLRSPKKKVPQQVWLAALIKRRGRYLIAQRPTSSMLGGLWELPSVRTDDGDNPSRRLSEKMGITIEVGDRLGEVKHTYSHFKLALHIHECTAKGRVKPSHYTDHAWCAPDGFGEYALHKAIHKALRLL